MGDLSAFGVWADIRNLDGERFSNQARRFAGHLAANHGIERAFQITRYADGDGRVWSAVRRELVGLQRAARPAKSGARKAS